MSASLGYFEHVSLHLRCIAFKVRSKFSPLRMDAILEGFLSREANR